MKCKICGYNINEFDTTCPGCDNDIKFLKNHNFITNEMEKVDKKKEKIKLNLVFLIPIIILIVLIFLYLFWINKNIPIITNYTIENIISNMKDNIDNINIYNNDINLHTSNDNESYYITDEINYYKYNENIEGINFDLIKINNYLFNEGEIKRVLSFIENNLILSKYKINYTKVYHNEQEIISLKISYNINNTKEIINIIKEKYVTVLSKIWNLNIEDTLSKLDTYNNIKLNIYTDILSRHVYKIIIDVGNIIELDILDNRINNLKYISKEKTIIIKDNEIKINTDDSLDIYKYNYDKYINDLNA